MTDRNCQLQGTLLPADLGWCEDVPTDYRFTQRIGSRLEDGAQKVPYLTSSDDAASGLVLKQASKATIHTGDGISIKMR